MKIFHDFYQLVFDKYRMFQASPPTGNGTYQTTTALPPSWNSSYPGTNGPTPSWNGSYPGATWLPPVWNGTYASTTSPGNGVYTTKSNRGKSNAKIILNRLQFDWGLSSDESANMSCDEKEQVQA